MNWTKYISVLSFMLFSVLSKAQMGDPASVEMADGMRSNGKIYVVVGVLCIVLVGFFVYLISTDLKLRKLEKEIEDK